MARSCRTRACSRSTELFRTSINPKRTDGTPNQWCLDISGNDGAPGNYSQIVDSPVQIGVETDKGRDNVTQWQTIRFGNPTVNGNTLMTDCWGQLVFLNTTGWVNSGAPSGQFTFGGVIHGDSQLTTVNKTHPDGSNGGKVRSTSPYLTWRATGQKGGPLTRWRPAFRPRRDCDSPLNEGHGPGHTVRAPLPRRARDLPAAGDHPPNEPAFTLTPHCRRGLLGSYSLVSIAPPSSGLLPNDEVKPAE
jgi:hypothetical protein